MVRKVVAVAKWQVKEAKSRFSELIELAETEGPQLITRHGKDKVVVLSVDEFRKLESTKPDFKEYLLSGPKVEDLVIERGRDLGRENEL